MLDSNAGHHARRSIRLRSLPWEAVREPCDGRAVLGVHHGSQCRSRRRLQRGRPTPVVQTRTVNFADSVRAVIWEAYQPPPPALLSLQGRRLSLRRNPTSQTTLASHDGQSTLRNPHSPLRSSRSVGRRHLAVRFSRSTVTALINTHEENADGSPAVAIRVQDAKNIFSTAVGEYGEPIFRWRPLESLRRADNACVAAVRMRDPKFRLAL